MDKGASITKWGRHCVHSIQYSLRNTNVTDQHQFFIWIVDLDFLIACSGQSYSPSIFFSLVFIPSFLCRWQTFSYNLFLYVCRFTYNFHHLALIFFFHDNFVVYFKMLLLWFGNDIRGILRAIKASIIGLLQTKLGSVSTHLNFITCLAQRHVTSTAYFYSNSV